jgi:DNA-directed RNA polymerase subunit RPC12/RpoP
MSSPIGGDPTGFKCSECGTNNLIWEEYGDSSSDVSELGTFCEHCEDVKTPGIDYGIA